jgi:NAD+ synthase (glutamine-hydrolysing)
MTSLRVALCQMRVHPGEPARNAGAMLRRIDEQRGKADLLVFPELCVPGYFVGDGWERPAFLRECELWNERLVAATAQAGAPAIVFGTVAVEWGTRGEDGRPRKYNAWVVARDGKALEHPGLRRAYGVKTLLPHYREFEDGRHFYDARELARDEGRSWEDFIEPVALDVPGGSLRLGVLLCEDAWEDDYVQKPVAALAAKRPDLVVNLSASPFTRGKNDKRNRVFAAKARLLGCPLAYVNAAGIQNNGKTLYTFDGRSTVYDREGVVVADAPAYEDTVEVVEIARTVDGGPWTVENEEKPGRKNVPVVSTVHRPPSTAMIPEVYEALAYGAQQFLASTGLDKVVIGASGGIDSAVSAALFASFLPPENLLLVNMPSRHNSDTTRNLAKQLADNLGCLYAEVPIEDSLAVTRAQLHELNAVSGSGSHSVTLKLEGLADENAQARDRGARVLAGIAQSFGAVFVCNANKAELTVGYGTLYGDIAGFLAPLGDLWKHEVYAVGHYLNDSVFGPRVGHSVIPQGIFDIVPSAELGAHHAVDEGKGDPLVYPYHDRLFFAFVQRWNRATPEEILEWYAAGNLAVEVKLPQDLDLKKLFPSATDFIADLERWWNLYNGIGVAKRVQAPPVLAVSSRAFGFDHRESLGPAVYTERYRTLKKRLLS